MPDESILFLLYWTVIFIETDAFLFTRRVRSQGFFRESQGGAKKVYQPEGDPKKLQAILDKGFQIIEGKDPGDADG